MEAWLAAQIGSCCLDWSGSLWLPALHKHSEVWAMCIHCPQSVQPLSEGEGEDSCQTLPHMESTLERLSIVHDKHVNEKDLYKWCVVHARYAVAMGTHKGRISSCYLVK